MLVVIVACRSASVPWRDKRSIDPRLRANPGCVPEESQAGEAPRWTDGLLDVEHRMQSCAGGGLEIGRRECTGGSCSHPPIDGRRKTRKCLRQTEVSCGGADVIQSCRYENE